MWILQNKKKNAYLENKTLFFLEIKKSFIIHQGLQYGKRLEKRNKVTTEVRYDIFYIKQVTNLISVCNFVNFQVCKKEPKL